MVSQPRPVLDRDDVASARAYFAYNDGNDFVISNLLSDGIVDAAFDRHSVSAIGDREADKTSTQSSSRCCSFRVYRRRLRPRVIFTSPNREWPTVRSPSWAR